MANHSYITAKKPIDCEAVVKRARSLIAEICKGNADFSIDTSSDVTVSTWDALNDKYICSQFWQAGKRKIEFRNPFGPNFIWWIHCSVQQDLAVFLDGTITDQGLPGTKLKIRPDFPRTFQGNILLIIKEENPPEITERWFFEKFVEPSIRKSYMRRAPKWVRE